MADEQDVFVQLKDNVAKKAESVLKGDTEEIDVIDAAYHYDLLTIVKVLKQINDNLTRINNNLTGINRHTK